MNEGASWLREPVDDHYTRPWLVRICSAVLAWWQETTDVVFLNSPWLKRSTGRALRCVWICIHLARWFILLLFDEEALEEATRCSHIQLQLMLMFVCFARVLWVAVMTEKDGIWSGLLLCIGLLVSFDSYGSIDGEFLSYEDLVFAMLTLFHCNVHPLGMWLVLGFAGALYARNLPHSPSLFESGVSLHCLISLCFIVGAWTIDFSNRIKAVSSGMLHGSGSDSIASAALQSPVAGRSGRIPCWLAGWNNWIWFVLYLKTTSVPAYQLVRASVLLCFLLLILGAYARNTLLGWRADIALGLLCHLPSELIFIHVNGCVKEWDVDVVGFSLVYDPDMIVSVICHAASVLATQTMIQAGCHPVVCAAFTLPLFIQTVWVCQSFAPDLSLYYTIYWMTKPVVCFILICSHFVDYFARMKAIREGFLSTEGNARSLVNVTTAIECLGEGHLVGKKVGRPRVHPFPFPPMMLRA